MAAILSSFQVRVGADASGTPRPAVDLELVDGAVLGPERLDRLALQLRDGLAAVNRDVRTSLAEFPAGLLPLVAAYPLGDGPFAGDAQRIKQRRIGVAPA